MDQFTSAGSRESCSDRACRHRTRVIRTAKSSTPGAVYSQVAGRLGPGPQVVGQPRQRIASLQIADLQVVATTAREGGAVERPRPRGSAAVPAHSPRPHPGDERRELPAQVQPGERPAPSSRRSRRRINRTLDAFSSCSCNVAALPDLLPSVTSQRVHFCSALLAPHPGALDTSARMRGLSARGRAFSALGGQEAKRS